jgi:hypothetical protein
MNPLRASQKTQDFKGHKTCLFETSAGIYLQNRYEYSPFSVNLDGRMIEGDFIVMGFNGYEANDEVKVEKNSYSTKFRLHDPSKKAKTVLDRKKNTTIVNDKLDTKLESPSDNHGVPSF